MIVTAVVFCAGGPDDPDPVVLVGGRPMVVRAVRNVLDAGVVGHVEVQVPAGRVDAVAAACRDLPVSVHASMASAVPIRTHADQRAGTAPGDGSVTSRSAPSRPDGIVLLHDAARPLAPPELAVSVVEAVRAGHPAAVPVLPMTDTVKQVAATGLITATPDRSVLRVVQTPMAVCASMSVHPPRQVLARLAESGVAVHTVPGHPLAFPIRTAWDIELAELLLTPGSGG